MDFEAYLYDRVLPVIQSWNPEDVYALSFFVYSNEAYKYDEYTNVSLFSIAYCTEEGCNHAPPLSEERWNLPCTNLQQETFIIDPGNHPENHDDGIKTLFKWYKELGLKNIGYEGPGDAYPVGYYELIRAVSNVAQRLQTEGVIKEKFGPIPIIVHDLEILWYLIEEMTEHANPGGEAELFLRAVREEFPEE